MGSEVEGMLQYVFCFISNPETGGLIWPKRGERKLFKLLWVNRKAELRVSQSNDQEKED